MGAIGAACLLASCGDNRLEIATFNNAASPAPLTSLPRVVDRIWLAKNEPHHVRWFVQAVVTNRGWPTEVWIGAGDPDKSRYHEVIDLNTELSVLASNGITYAPTRGPAPGCPRYDYRELNVEYVGNGYYMTGDETGGGCVPFAVPFGVNVVRITFHPNTGHGRLLVWHVPRVYDGDHVVQPFSNFWSQAAYRTCQSPGESVIESYTTYAGLLGNWYRGELPASVGEYPQRTLMYVCLLQGPNLAYGTPSRVVEFIPGAPYGTSHEQMTHVVVVRGSVSLGLVAPPTPQSFGPQDR